jgi:aspartyl-tRNA(Asn)/glutamyl-tRNA(Gln) amidotransferase subunit A
MTVAESIGRTIAGLRADPFNAVTRVLSDRALTAATAIDVARAEGRDAGPLAGLPFGVKDLFDLAGWPTTAGAAMRRDAAPAASDAEAVRRLSAAGAIPVATLNMDEYAYGFATVNATWGTTRNPHDPKRLAGGSSGGSAAAIAGGLLPFALGTDTNGSIRVPASLCGVWGLKPTHGSLPMAGVYPFVDSFDDIGPLTRSATDLAMIHAVLAGEDDGEPAGFGAAPRVAVLGGWFARNLTPPLAAAIATLAVRLGGLEQVELPGVDRARSAAFLMTAAEGGHRHLPALRDDAMGFDPATRERLIAGAAMPVAAYLDAKAYREIFRDRVAALFADWDVLIAPAAPGVAPPIEDALIEVNGKRVEARANLGLFTQPLSFVGLPVVAAPLGLYEGLPLGIQLIGAPGSDRALLSFACGLERCGLLGAAVCPLPALASGAAR